MNFIKLTYRYFYRLYYAFGLLFLIVVLGTVGYMTVMGWGFVDSLYMTIITFSTVGFEEVHELDQMGRIFTAFMIVSSFGIFAYCVTVITNYLVGGEYKIYLKRFKTTTMVKKLHQHTILCGYGRVGKQAADDLLYQKKDFIIIEKDDNMIEYIKEQHPQVAYLHDNATNDEVLEEARISHAQFLITTLPDDSDNLYVVLTAREMNPELTIIARASKPYSLKKLKMAGADDVIMPDLLGGEQMASLVVNPDVVKFIDEIKIKGGDAINLEEISFEKLPEGVKYKTIGDLNYEMKTGCNIIGYKSAQGEFIVNPGKSEKLSPGSKLFVLGSQDQLSNLNQLFRIKQ